MSRVLSADTAWTTCSHHRLGGDAQAAVVAGRQRRARKRPVDGGAGAGDHHRVDPHALHQHDVVHQHRRHRRFQHAVVDLDHEQAAAEACQIGERVADRADRSGHAGGGPGARAATRRRARTLTSCHLRADIFFAMITNRSLRFAFCALLLLAPLATLAAQDADMMKDDGSFYVSAAYGVALPADREIGDDTVSTDLGFLGGRVGVGYSIFGFRPELSAGYRMATIKDSEGKDSVTSMDLIASVYYDVDTGSEITPTSAWAAAYRTSPSNRLTIANRCWRWRSRPRRVSATRSPKT